MEKKNIIKSDKNGVAKKENTCFVVGKSSMGGVRLYFLPFFLMLSAVCISTSVARFNAKLTHTHTSVITIIS